MKGESVITRLILCEKCDKEIADKERLIEHLREVHGEDPSLVMTRELVMRLCGDGFHASQYRLTTRAGTTILLSQTKNDPKYNKGSTR